MLPEIRKRAQKAGSPPGTAVYTGKKRDRAPKITVITYNAKEFYETSGTSLEECLAAHPLLETTWINIEGLNNSALIHEVAEHYKIHPLTIEDILNVEQRPKLEEFDNYIFATLKMLHYEPEPQGFSSEQLSLILGKNFLISFLEQKTTVFKNIYERIKNPGKQLCQQGSDYLMYRMIDIIVDGYFFVFEELGNQIEILEQKIISSPSKQNSNLLYHLKRRMLILRKIVWPLREVISHLLQIDGELITSSTGFYLRDVYDHVAQAIDILETYRDMLSGMLDVYLSSLSMRLNEVMKVLTVIATIFIPITFIASVYGMNFQHMPELQWRWSYPAVLLLMLTVALGMVSYFKRKKWF